MGILIWTLAGLLSFAIARFIETGRRRWYLEALTALGSALLAGLVATALDFGGWAVEDGRAFAFAGLVSLLGIGLLRTRKHRGRQSRGEP